MKGKSMVEGAPWKSIVKFALPVMFGSLLQQLYNTADTAIVGHYGNKTALPAVGTTGSIAFLFLRKVYNFDLLFCLDSTVMAIPYFLLGHYLNTYRDFGKRGSLYSMLYRCHDTCKAYLFFWRNALCSGSGTF